MCSGCGLTNHFVWADFRNCLKPLAGQMSRTRARAIMMIVMLGRAFPKAGASAASLR